MKDTPSQEPSASMRLLLKAWFSVTFNERLTILVVLGLFLLGLGARTWRLSREHGAHQNPPPVSRAAEH
jgi:hypothetical protein